MFQPNDKINPEPPENNDLEIDKEKIDREKNLDNIDRNVSPKNVAQQKKQIEKVFFKLIAFGLIFGAILSVGAYYLLNKLGLTKKPYEIEREKIEQQERSPSLEEIRTIPQIPNSTTEI